MIMAGYETTTSGSRLGAGAAAAAPHALQRLRAELYADDDSYLDAVVKETLRVRPVVPVVARSLREPAEVAGLLMPAGTTLMVSIYLLHTDPDAYPSPMRSARSASSAGCPRAAWIPFGGGVRRCLGASFAQLEMKVVLREVLTSTGLRATSQRPEKPKRKRFTLAPAEGAVAIVEEAPTGTPRAPRRRSRLPRPRRPRSGRPAPARARRAACVRAAMAKGRADAA